MTTDVPLLAIRDLTVAFRTRDREVTAVHGLSLEIQAGQTVAVVGESGSGKSTTAAAINRLLPGNGRIVSGEVLFEGQDLAQASERRLTAIRGAGIGLVPQDPMSNLNPLMRIGEQIAEALIVHGQGNGARAKAIELLEQVGIPEPERRAGQYPHEFSGGMRQRALIAMGLACRPRLLIADEPTSALDVTVQRRILDQLEQLTAEMGTAILLITHDLALAAERADTILVMHRGEIVEAGPAAEIVAAPQHEYTQRLLRAAPSLTSVSMVTELKPADLENPADLVQIEDLRKVFTLRASRSGAASEFTAVDGVSLTIPRGQTVSIVGESGSGKSTTANLLLGLDDITSVPPPGAARVPEPVRRPRPQIHRRAVDRGTATSPPGRHDSDPHQGCQRVARPGLTAVDHGGETAPRTLWRPAPTRGDRPGSRPLPRTRRTR
jgi:peptide/nickel transport system ATP-binding protein